MQRFFSLEERLVQAIGHNKGENVDNEMQRSDTYFIRETSVHGDNQAVIRIPLNAAGIDRMIGTRD